MSDLFRTVCLLIFLILTAGCGGVPPTAALPTETASPSSPVIQVPDGNMPTIDGTFSSGEWDGALTTDLVNGGELMLMHNDGYLYLGIQSREMGYGSICTADDNQVSILHSSAGLGTAIFERDGPDWRRIQQFSFCCWEAYQSELNAFLQRDGWVASVGTKGVPEEMEYKIAMNDGSLNLAVVYVDDFTYETVLYWPENLNDDCLGLVLIPEDPPERLSFSPETWVTITASTSTSSSPPKLPSTGDGVLAFTSEQDGNMEIYVMNADGSDPQRLTDQPGEDYWPTWSPDGAQIAFASDRDGDFEIYAMNADGTDQRRLTHEAGNDLEPAWSPAGDRIVFMVHRNGKSDIYIMDSDGSGRQPLTDSAGDNYLPKWSPGGDRIVFVSERDGNPEIYVMNADGSAPRRLTDNPSEDRYPSWSPDGTQISFYSVREGLSGLYVMNTDGGELSQLTHDDAAVWVSDWGPDGSRIVFTSDRDGNREIYILDLDSGNLERLTENTVLDGIPAWQP